MITDLPTSAITVTNSSQSLYLQDGGKNQLEQNYVTVTLCIELKPQLATNCTAVPVRHMQRSFVITDRNHQTLQMSNKWSK